MTKLRRCPFCGGEFASVFRIGENRENYANPEYFEVICDVHNGGCGAAIGGEYPTEEEAISAWNKRAEEINTAADNVNHPAHYTQGNIECIDAMQSAFGAAELAVYCKIAAFKYLWRSEHKNGVEDIKKALWYTTKYIELMEKKNESKD